MLNKIWLLFFVVAALAIFLQLTNGNTAVLSASVNAIFDSAKLAANIALGLIGVLTLWMGLMRVGERAGVVNVLAKMIEPLLSRLMPEVPRGHKAYGSVTMNLIANMLGLDNAATPLGLKAMHDLHFILSECNCSADGTEDASGSCSDEGICQCNEGFVGAKCDNCMENYYGYPTCASK